MYCIDIVWYEHSIEEVNSIFWLYLLTVFLIRERGDYLHGWKVTKKRYWVPRKGQFAFEQFMYHVQGNLVYLCSKRRDGIFPSSSIWILDNRSSFFQAVYSNCAQSIPHDTLLRGEGWHFPSELPFSWSYKSNRVHLMYRPPSVTG